MFKDDKVLGQIPILNQLQTAKGQQVLSNLTGLDVPFKQIDKIYSGIKNNDPRKMITDTFTLSGNVNTDKLNKTYDEIDELQTIMKQYQQQGVNFSTIQELKKANKNKNIAKLNAIFAKYGIK